MTNQPAITTQPAAIQVRHGRNWWVCPSCKRTLGEVKHGIVIIEMRNHRLQVGGAVIKQVCPHCQCESEYERAA